MKNKINFTFWLVILAIIVSAIIYNQNNSSKVDTQASHETDAEVILDGAKIVKETYKESELANSERTVSETRLKKIYGSTKLACR